MIEKISSKVVYANKWMTVREDQVRFGNGASGIFGVVDKPDFSLIMPFENGGFYLVRQFRYPVSETFWEFPQGAYVGRVLSPLENAIQELKEETGLSSTQLKEIGFLYEAYGYCNQGFHIYFATSLTKGIQQLEETEQDLVCQWFSLTEVEALMDRGEIRDAPTAAAYGLFLRKRQELI